jgi:hypothetical protein
LTGRQAAEPLGLSPGKSAGCWPIPWNKGRSAGAWATGDVRLTTGWMKAVRVKIQELAEDSVPDYNDSHFTEELAGGAWPARLAPPTADPPGHGTKEPAQTPFSLPPSSSRAQGPSRDAPAGGWQPARLAGRLGALAHADRLHRRC